MVSKLRRRRVLPGSCRKTCRATRRPWSREETGILSPEIPLQCLNGRHGVFDIVRLFSEALHEKPFVALTKDEQKLLLARFEHEVSDQLPLWLRLPLP